MTKYVVTDKVAESPGGSVSVNYPEDYITSYPSNHKDFRPGDIFEFPGSLEGWETIGLVEVFDGSPRQYSYGKKKPKHRTIDDPWILD
jgi:hypothetical protein